MESLVSPPWLAAHLQDPHLVVLDATLPPVGVVPAVDVRARYRAQHIPGAVFFDIEWLSERNTTLPHMLPSPERFAEEMAALGVGSEATVVVYEQSGVFSAPRAWWMLRTLGALKVHVLDGDLAAWAEAGYLVEAGEVRRPRAVFHPQLDPAAVSSLRALNAALAAGAPVLDARSAGRFAGTAPEPRAGLRSGHMPGALSLPYTDLVRDGRLLPKEALQAALLARGLDLGRPVITTCGSGVTAAVLALALERAGASAVSLYDGSWAEYAQQPGAVIEQSAEAIG